MKLKLDDFKIGTIFSIGGRIYKIKKINKYLETDFECIEIGNEFIKRQIYFSVDYLNRNNVVLYSEDDYPEYYI